MDNKRRKLLATGLSALGAMFAVNAKADNGEKVKVLTKDGKLIEIPARKVRKKKSRAEEEEVRTWIRRNK